MLRNITCYYVFVSDDDGSGLDGVTVHAPSHASYDAVDGVRVQAPLHTTHDVVDGTRSAGPSVESYDVVDGARPRLPPTAESGGLSTPSLQTHFSMGFETQASLTAWSVDGHNDLAEQTPSAYIDRDSVSF